MISKVLDLRSSIDLTVSDAKVIEQRFITIDEAVSEFDNKCVEFDKNNLDPPEWPEKEGVKGKRTISQPGKSCFACAPDTAAPACWAILEQSSKAKNGYYWIHTACSSIARRVYCDFDTDLMHAFAYVGGGESIKSDYDIKYACAKIGLEPIMLEESQLVKLNLYVADQGADLGSPQIVPYARDYTCD